MEYKDECKAGEQRKKNFVQANSRARKHHRGSTAMGKEEDAEDYGALIYRESQLRKKEAAAVAAKSTKKSESYQSERKSRLREKLPESGIGRDVQLMGARI